MQHCESSSFRYWSCPRPGPCVALHAGNAEHHFKYSRLSFLSAWHVQGSAHAVSQLVFLLGFCCRPVYQPSEDRLAYTAVRTVSVDQSSLALANGAVNKLVEQYTKGDTHGAPLLLTAADIKDSLVLSDVSLFIDAAFVPAKHSSSRRWLQVPFCMSCLHHWAALFPDPGV